MNKQVYQYADLKQRFFAGLIDRLLIFLLTISFIVFSTIFIYNKVFIEYSFREFIVFFSSVLLSIIFSYSINFIFYYLINDVLFGNSIGKKILKLHMVDLNTMKRMSKKKALKHMYYRYLCELSIFPYFVTNDKKQIFHDEKSEIIIIKYN